MTPRKGQEEDKEIPELCNQTFLQKGEAMRTFFKVCAVLVAIGGSAVTWAFAIGGSVSALETKAVYQGQEITKLNTAINQKLDVLIERSKSASSKN